MWYVFIWLPALADDAHPQRAFYIHIRILWGLLSVVELPKPPSDGMIATFEQRFASFDDVVQARAKPNVPISNEDMINRISELRGDPKSTSMISKQVARVPESSLRYMLGLLARFGLKAWRPDLRQSPYSMYNQAHRFIAIDTFRQAVVSEAYDSMGIDKSYVDDMNLQVVAFDHFTNHRIGRMAAREEKFPGITQIEADREPVLSRRRTVSFIGCIVSAMSSLRAQIANSRGDWLKKAGYPHRVVKLVRNVDGTSDDEEGMGKLAGGATGTSVPVYWIKAKKGRSEILTKFVRWIDIQRKAHSTLTKGSKQGPVAQAKRKAGAAERIRVVPKSRPMESEEALPRDIALDYYDPSIFNKLELTFRASFAKKPRIAMPENFDELIKDADPPLAWRTMSDKDWMEKVGNERLKAYRIPKDKPARHPDDSNSSDSDSDDEDAIYADDTLEGARRKFASATTEALGPMASADGPGKKKKNTKAAGSGPAGPSSRPTTGRRGAASSSSSAQAQASSSSAQAQAPSSGWFGFGSALGLRGAAAGGQLPAGPQAASTSANASSEIEEIASPAQESGDEFMAEVDGEDTRMD